MKSRKQKTKRNRQRPKYIIRKKGKKQVKYYREQDGSYRNENDDSDILAVAVVAALMAGHGVPSYSASPEFHGGGGTFGAGGATGGWEPESPSSPSSESSSPSSDSSDSSDSSSSSDSGSSGSDSGGSDSGGSSGGGGDN